MNVTAQEVDTSPIRKTFRVNLDPARAFELFTSEIHTWWPLGTHAVDTKAVEACAFEGREGGRFYERHASGDEHLWGTVLAWEPPGRLMFTFHPGGTPDEAQEIEVLFLDEDDGTLVEFESRGWENLDAAKRSAYDTGWEFVVVECYGKAED